MGHEGRLGGVEAADGAAGNRDEQAGEDGLSLESDRRSAVAQALPEFRQRRPLDQQSDEQRHGHEEQGEGEERIDAADDLVDGHEGRDQIVDEDDPHPDHQRGGRAAGHPAQDDGRGIDEHGSDQDQQDHGEDQHHGLGAFAQVIADELRQSGAPIAYGKHSGEVVMHRTGEDAAEHDPEIGGGTELGAHNGAEDGTRPRNVEELDHENLPTGHLDVVDAVRPADGRRRTGRVGAEDLLGETSVEKITQDEGTEADEQ